MYTYDITKALKNLRQFLFGCAMISIVYLAVCYTVVTVKPVTKEVSSYQGKVFQSEAEAIAAHTSGEFVGAFIIQE